MKNSYAMLAILVASILALSSCKSGETTSAMLKNEHGNYEEAVAMAKLAIEKNPNDADAHYQLGVSYSYTDDMAGSYREFMTAARLNPKKLPDIETNIKANWSRHYNSGLSEFQTGNTRGAAHEFDLATQADPRQVKGWLNLGKVYYGMAESDSTYMPKVYATVDSLLARNKNTDDPNYANALALEGRILAKRGMTAEAAKIFEDLLTIDPMQYKVAEESAREYLSKKDWQNGSDVLRLVVAAEQKTNSESFETYYNLGAACLNLKDFPKAIDAFTEALRIDPLNKKGRYYMLLADYQGNQFDDAILVGQEYTTKYPDDANGWHVLSLAYGKKGMTIKAQEAAKKAADLNQ